MGEHISKPSLWTRYKAWEAARCMKRSLALRPEVFRGYMQEYILAASEKQTMNRLEREGFLHCVQCAQRFGLKKIGNVLACKRHEADARMADLDEVAAR